MATLIKRPQSPYWYAQFYTDAGNGQFKQHRLSTKIRWQGLNKKDAISNKKQAEAAASRMEEEVKAMVPDNAQGRAIADEVYSILKQASIEALNGSLSVDKGKAHLIAMTSLCAGTELVEHSLDSWRDEFLKTKEETDRVSSSSLTKYKQHLREFVNHLTDAGKVKLPAVSSDDIRDYQRHLTAQGLSISTVNAHLKSIKAYFRKALHDMQITHSPANAVSFIHAKKSDVASRKPFSTDEINAIIKAAPSPEWKAFIKMGFYTGLRLSDIASLKWSNINQEDSTIEIVTAKTEKELSIPIFSDDLLNDLKKLGLGVGDAPLFPELSQMTVGARDGLSQTFTGIMDTASVGRGKKHEAEQDEGKETRGRTRFERGFHSLRGSFVSHLANLNVPKEIRMKLTGHDDAKVHDLYTTIEKETMRAHIESLPQVG